MAFCISHIGGIHPGRTACHVYVAFSPAQLQRMSCICSIHLVSVILHSETHGLNAKLGRYRRTKGKCMCNLCNENYKSVGHFLWKCPAYSKCHALFLERFKRNEGKYLSTRKAVILQGKSHFILDTELWGGGGSLQ